jgi:hypothetical protein
MLEVAVVPEVQAGPMVLITMVVLDIAIISQTLPHIMLVAGAVVKVRFHRMMDHLVLVV